MKYMKKRDGFTLIEMLIVIALMAIMATVFLSYDRSGERQVILIGEQAKVVALLNRAKTLAMGGDSDSTIEDIKNSSGEVVTVSIGGGNTVTVKKANGTVPSAGMITLAGNIKISGSDITFTGPSLKSSGGNWTLTSGSLETTIEVTSAGAITYK